MSRRVSRAAARIYVDITLNQQLPERVQFSIDHSTVQSAVWFFRSQEGPGLSVAISIDDDVVAVGGSLHFDMEHIVWVALESRHPPHLQELPHEDYYCVVCYTTASRPSVKDLRVNCRLCNLLLRLYQYVEIWNVVMVPSVHLSTRACPISCTAYY